MVHAKDLKARSTIPVVLSCITILKLESITILALISMWIVQMLQFYNNRSLTA